MLLILVLLAFATLPARTQIPPVDSNLKKETLRDFCITPPQPDGGDYTLLEGVPHPTLKFAYESFTLSYKCNTNFLMRNGDELIITCVKGYWDYNIPDCEQFEKLYARAAEEYNTKPIRPVQEDCEMPQHPRGGRYSLVGKPDASPTDVFPYFQLTITCSYRYQVEGPDSTFCVKGQWSDNLPKCVHISSGCHLNKHSSIEYRCKNDTHNFGLCGDEVPSGTSVALRCKSDFEDNNLWQISSMHCVDGYWDSVAVCTPVAGDSDCRLQKHPSVEYRCSSDSPGYRECNDVEPAESIARLRCKTKGIPKATSSSAQSFCADGNWHHMTSCTPKLNQNDAECGRQSGNRPLIFGGKEAVRGEVPWHVGIYSKIPTPYMLICGGSLISHSLIISAAHCFWNDVSKQLPASRYAVAVGKLLRGWNDPRDIDAQMSDVSEIIIPPLYQGNSANYQDDIALLRIASPFVYGRHVRPICLDFDYDFEKKQLMKGNAGMVGGWGLTSADSGRTPVLRVVDMPYVTLAECIQGTSPSFAAYITSDKLCAGTNGSAVCRGDSGGGLAFRDTKHGITRYYLRGIVSTAPNSGVECDGTTYATFTNVNRHQHYIRDYL